MDQQIEGLPQTEDERLEKELNRLKLVCGKLSEFFDTVQIFCTKQAEDNKSTDKFEYGQGNGYAIYGQVKSFVIATEQAFKMDILCSDDEDDEVDKL
jgi:hypothetical protein